MSKMTFAIGLALMGGVVPLVQADAGTVKSNMNVSFMGINVAQMNSVYEVNGKSYLVTGSVKTNGLAALVADTKARFLSRGIVSGDRLFPDQHELTFSQRRKNGRLALSFTNGNVTSAEVIPKVTRKKGQVPLLATHLKSVLDPISALMFPVAGSQVGSGNGVCNRTVPVYDGNNRLNLRFSYKGTKQVEAKGYKGKAFVCNVRYEPIAGHRPQRQDTKFMMANRDMEVTMARIGQSNAYGLFGFRVKTRRGLATGVATAFLQQ